MSEPQIYRDLKADHDKQRAMLKQLSEQSGDTSERRTLFETFRLELQSHAAAEEESLYAVMLGNPDLRDDARHSVSEHKEVDDLLGGDTEFLRQHLHDRDTRVGQLRDDVALNLVRRGDLVEDRAHRRHVGARDRRRVRRQLQGALEILARLHPGRRRTGCGRRSLTHTERGALHGRLTTTLALMQHVPRDAYDDTA